MSGPKEIDKDLGMQPTKGVPKELPFLRQSTIVSFRQEYMDSLLSKLGHMKETDQPVELA